MTTNEPDNVHTDSVTGQRSVVFGVSEEVIVREGHRRAGWPGTIQAVNGDGGRYVVKLGNGEIDEFDIDELWPEDSVAFAQRDLRAALDGLDLNEDEQHIVKWLQGWDQPTLHTFAGIIRKARTDDQNEGA